MSDSDTAIEARGLTCYFGTTSAVRDLDLSVPRGCVFALLGRNGSGKTTAIRAFLGLLEPTRGSSRILGHDSRALPPRLRERIGYLPEGHPVHGWMRVSEAAAFQASFQPKWSQRLFDAVVDHFSIAAASRSRNLSRGQRAGLCLALTLASRPELLVLDDPSLGLDPVARHSLLEAMVQFTRREGRTILLASHLLSDVERVADRIAVLDRGALKASCPLDTFRERVRRVVLHPRSDSLELPTIPGLLSSRRSPGEIVLTVANFNGETERALKSLDVERIEYLEIGLEDAFIGYLGERGEKSFFLDSVDEEP